MTLGRKILIGFVICASILITVAVISYRNGDKLTETNYWVTHTYEVLYEFEQILLSSVDAQSSTRGYIITGNEDFLNPYYVAKLNMQEHLAKVKELTIDNPVQQKNIEALANQINEEINYLERCMEVRQKSAEQAFQLVSSGEGKRIMERIKNVVNDSKAIENDLLAKRLIASDEDTRSFNLLFISLLVVISLVLIAVYVIIILNLKALRRAEEETANKNWTLTGSGDLVKNMQGNRQVIELSQIVINYVTTYLNAQVGAIYILQEDEVHLKMAAAHAIDKNITAVPLISLGEGVVGQVAAENKAILLTSISNDYFIINTGLGKITPQNIIVLPLVFEKKVIGVIELGSLNSFTEIQKQYLALIADAVAIAITSSQARDKTRELLEETQRQAEELETQQEELKQSNEELQEKTQLLERSEAELKAQQEELQQSNEELEEKANLLEEQKEKLENAKMEIETKARELEVTSKYKSEFLANMSHELRTPLNSILILAQLLSENKNKVLGEKEVEFSKNIYSSGSDLLNLINEILDLSKVEAGKMELDIVEVPFQEIFNDMSSMFSEVAKNKSIEFKIDFNDKKIKSDITTDKQRLEQILRNLLSNAFKFTGKGGRVTLSVDVARESFKNKKLNEAADVIAFSVTDSGIGIPKDKQAIIFEAFQQADGSTKRKYGGTGLGLSISRELSSALGGEIHLKSEDGKGSTFTLYLPLHFDQSMMSTERKVEVKQTKSTPLPTNGEETTVEETDVADDDRHHIQENDRVVLILEDDVEFAKLLLGFVRERNYKGIIAYQGSTGVSYARKYKPDAILLDMQLPAMDGGEVLRQLKNDPNLRHIPVQIISGHDRRKEGIELGAFDFIRKPMSIDDFRNAFDRIEDFVSRKLKKLLIVEDNETQNRAIRELIGNGDVKCFSAYSGNEAYEMLTKEGFDSVIVDLGLPDMSGFELLEKIKSNTQLKKVPIIVYTGRDLTKEESSTLSMLASTVVLKTVNSKERLFDETSLFLHRVESKLPKEKQDIIRKLHKSDEVLKNKKILIVDDDIRNIYSLTNALEGEGLDCITAENGKSALKTLTDNPSIDLVLMDVMMPEMDGYEATTEIRKIDKFSKLPIIALTAKAMKGDREKCLSVGMSDYVSKPVNMEQLLSLMRVWLYK